MDSYMWCFLTLLAVVYGNLLSPPHDLTDIDKEGILHVNEAWGLQPGGSLFHLRSAKFPEPAPAKMQQTWRYVVMPGNSLRVTCYSISLPKLVNGECGDWKFKTIVGGNAEVTCGDIGYFSKLFETEEIRFELTTGSIDRGEVNCTVQGRAMGPYGEVTDPPATPPPPTTPSYLLTESEERDSSEDGIAPGRQTTNCTCGIRNRNNARIIGGREAELHEFPHIVLLSVQWNHQAVFCGGSLITKSHVLTAAHCTWRYREAGVPLAVIIGAHDFTEGKTTNITEAVNVVQIIEHEKFNRGSLVNDIALLVLEKDITFTSTISPICLPTKRLNLRTENIVIAGWGRTERQGSMSPVLKTANVRVVPIEQCLGLPTENPIHLCVYGKNRSSCQGDSGGPVMWLDPETNRYTLVGLVSWGYVCASTTPVVNAAVDAFIDWIQYHIKATRMDAYSCTKTIM